MRRHNKINFTVFAGMYIYPAFFRVLSSFVRFIFICSLFFLEMHLIRTAMHLKVTVQGVRMRLGNETVSTLGVQRVVGNIMHNPYPK
jgi:hypothetical protein